MLKYTLVLFVVLPFVNNTFFKKDVIVWNEEVALSWSDFKGRAKNNKDHIAMSRCGIHMEQSSYTLPQGKPTYSFYAFFEPESSWYLKDKVTDKTLLHEQLHFDIAELYARKLRKIFSEREVDPASSKSVFDKTYKKYRRMQQQYDKETKNGTYEQAQRNWFLKIKNELKQNSEFKND